MPHTHTCRRCEFAWDCVEGKPLARCMVTVAAKANRAGPVCDVCCSIEMAMYAADARGLTGLAAELSGLLFDQKVRGEQRKNTA